MTIDELIEKLNEIGSVKTSGDLYFPQGNPDHNHMEADKLLLEFINDKRVTDAFENIERWYS